MQDYFSVKSTQDLTSKNLSKNLTKIQIEELKTDLRLKVLISYFLLAIFGINTISTLVAVFMVGLGKLSLPDIIILSLIGETVAHAAAMFLTITKYLFPQRNR